MTIYKAGARHQIIGALSRDGMLPVSELVSATGLTADQVKNNTSAAKQAGLIVSVRDDVTQQPAWKLTPAGRDWWKANGSAKNKADKPGVSVHKTTPAATESGPPSPAAVARQQTPTSAPAAPPAAADGGDSYEDLLAIISERDATVAQLQSENAELQKVIGMMDKVGNDRLQILQSQKAQIGALEKQMRITADPSPAMLETVAPSAYLIRAHKRKLRLLTREESAIKAAVGAVRNGSHYAEVFALTPCGSASRAATYAPRGEAIK